MNPVEHNYIWKHRNKAHMGQKRVAHFLKHANSSRFAQWERHERMPSVKNLFKMAYIFGVPAEVLYADLYRSCAEEVEEQKKSLSPEETKVENDLLVV